MERHANYALVGLISIGLFIGLTIFVFWLARLQFSRDFDTYDILFVGPVRGLVEGGEVHFNGIKVGEVTRIQLDSRDTTRVIARARITSDVPVRTDSFATLEPQGITGVNYVQITAGTQGGPLLKDTVPPDQVPVLKTQRSALSDLLEGGGTVLSRTIEALDRVNRVLSDGNIASLSGSFRNIEGLTSELSAQTSQIGPTLAQADATLKSVDQAAKDLGSAATSAQGLIEGDGRKVLAQISEVAADLQAASRDARSMIGRLEGPTADFATNGLPQVTAAVASLQQAAENIDRLAREIERNPRALIAKPPARELEVQP